MHTLFLTPCPRPAQRKAAGGRGAVAEVARAAHVVKTASAHQGETIKRLLTTRGRADSSDGENAPVESPTAPGVRGEDGAPAKSASVAIAGPSGLGASLPSTPTFGATTADNPMQQVEPKARAQVPDLRI